MGKKEPCKGGCGVMGCFWSDPKGRCLECRKIDCKGCGKRITPNRTNELSLCYECKVKRKARERGVMLSC